MLKEVGVQAFFRGVTAARGRISPESGLSVSGVYHQAVVQVDERGTEAVASKALLAAEGRQGLQAVCFAGSVSCPKRWS